MNQIGIIAVLVVVGIYIISTLFSFQWKADSLGLERAAGTVGYNDVPEIAELQEASGITVMPEAEES
jgi:hypothetical protein